MTKTVRILAEAAQEALGAAAWYESQHVGLGHDFLAALDAALDLLEGEVVPLTPMIGAPGQRGAKRLLLRRFPYMLVVIERSEEYLVLAVAHNSRHPEYWSQRKP